jgi:hypothetical protein
MREVNPVVFGYEIQIAALDTALRAALPGKVFGVSTYGPTRPISIWLEDTTTPTDEGTALAIAANHDPIFLASDKTAISADGSDHAAITVTAPRFDAAPVTLLIAGVAVPVTMTGGVGTVEITAIDPGTIPVSVQSPDNRSYALLGIVAA